MRLRPLRTALVLGGGGARGLAHIGVLDALREAGLSPDMVVGTSMGAIVGAAYALDPGSTELEKRFRGLLGEERVARVERRFAILLDETRAPGWRGRVANLLGTVRRVIAWNRHAMARSLVDSVLITEMIERLVGGLGFDAVRIPFYAVAYDLAEAADVVIGSGDLNLALRASGAIPGVFEPVAVDGRLLVDGAVFQELPTVIARRLGADFVIAVDVGRGADGRPPTSAAEVLQRVLLHRGDRLRLESRTFADVVIAPAVAGIHWSEFSRAADCCAAGAAAAREQLALIARRQREVRRRTLFRRLRAARPAITVSIIRAAEGPAPPAVPAGPSGT